jgi:hypothetical protein
MSQNEKPSANAFPWKEILGLLGMVLVAYIGYITSLSQIKIPIHATQTAEAKLAFTAIPPSTSILSTPASTLLPIITITVTNTFIPVAPTSVDQFNISVPANVYWYNTHIIVRKGQQLEFTATGKWDSGIHPSGPDGDSSHDCDNRYIICGKLGALVGAIGTPYSDKNDLKAAAFLIGSSSTQTAASDGILFLAMNENLGSCKEGVEGSCYDDNLYSLEVVVTVK